MYIDHLKSGTRVYLHRRGDSASGGILTRVEMLAPDKREVYVYSPKVDGRPISLSAEEQYYFRLVSDSSVYRFKVKFLSHGEIDGFDITSFKLMDTGEKTQRRSTFRFNVSKNIVFSVIYTSGHQSEKEEGLLVDLSAGGAKIFTDRKMNIGYLLNIDLQLDDDSIVTYGDVRTASDLPNGSRFAYQYGIRFAMIPESDQEKIIRYMYKKQREDLKRANSRRL